VDVNVTTRAIFGKDVIKRKFASVLIYRLQRKDNLKSNVDNASMSPQLLIIWRSDNRSEYSVRVLLIIHDNTITLNEDKLRELDYPHLTLLRNDCIIKNIWILDNTTALMTTSRWEKQIRTVEITISKGARKDNSIEPLCVSSNM
jgi:hypothetical protein